MWKYCNYTTTKQFYITLFWNTTHKILDFYHNTSNKSSILLKNGCLFFIFLMSDSSCRVPLKQNLLMEGQWLCSLSKAEHLHCITPNESLKWENYHTQGDWARWFLNSWYLQLNIFCEQLFCSCPSSPVASLFLPNHSTLNASLDLCLSLS